MGLPEALLSSDATPEELRQRIVELAEAVTARDTFIAVAAHELRNPMTPMIGQIDLLLAGVKAGKYTPEQIEQRLGRIRHVMNHYVKRASVLLNVSRITSGQNRLDPTPFDLAELIRKIVETFAEAAHHAGCSIGITAPAHLHGTWDRLAMEQIIDNLISNAVKYGAHRPVEVHVEPIGNDARISVRDNGCGISAEDRDRIFGRFERAVGVNDTHSGFGIELWVVSQHVMAMGGTITISDAPGGGSVFSVTVPLHITRNPS
jgi:two-component system, OmpR family, sensor kinase